MFRFLVIPILFCLLSSCSSVEAKAKWLPEDVSDAKKPWRICNERLDGAKKHHKGFCYISQECRKRLFRKKECRPNPLFCAWGALKCYSKYGLFNKKLR